jgi:hypothetical protein
LPRASSCINITQTQNPKSKIFYLSLVPMMSSIQKRIWLVRLTLVQSLLLAWFIIIFFSCQAVLLHLRSGEETDIGPGACDDRGPVCQVASLSLSLSLSLCAYMRTSAFFLWLHLWIWLKRILKMAKHIWGFFFFAFS